jgi:hypothetical protein
LLWHHICFDFAAAANFASASALAFILQLVSLCISICFGFVLRLAGCSIGCWHQLLLLHLVQLPQVVLQQLVLVLFHFSIGDCLRFGGSISSNFLFSIFFEQCFGLSSILNLVCASASAVAFASAIAFFSGCFQLILSLNFSI